nr:MAG TPA: hypothetical protein [Caudoviricetes sp.]
MGADLLHFDSGIGCTLTTMHCKFCTFFASYNQQIDI